MKKGIFTCMFIACFESRREQPWERTGRRRPASLPRLDQSFKLETWDFKYSNKFCDPSVSRDKAVCRARTRTEALWGNSKLFGTPKHCWWVRWKCSSPLWVQGACCNRRTLLTRVHPDPMSLLSKILKCTHQLTTLVLALHSCALIYCLLIQVTHHPGWAPARCRRRHLSCKGSVCKQV